jgi:cytochrome c553
MADTWRRSARVATASTAPTPASPRSSAGAADRFTKTLEFYRTGERTNPVMVSVVKSLDDTQIRALAAYYASLPNPSEEVGWVKLQSRLALLHR